MCRRVGGLSVRCTRLFSIEKSKAAQNGMCVRVLNDGMEARSVQYHTLLHCTNLLLSVSSEHTVGRYRPFNASLVQPHLENAKDLFQTLPEIAAVSPIPMKQPLKQPLKHLAANFATKDG